MKNSKDFPFEKARRISSKEVAEGRKAVEEKTGKKRSARGRPAKSSTDKFVATSIRLHPRALAWAKREAKKRGVGYQTVINELLLEKAVS
ncbi:MAG: BrnA antitoxin family protein [Bdellovibrionaceae bacterium]|nr:BrnA antitoxin family protein [Pseudobdellovibrionaceae bacterium]